MSTTTTIKRRFDVPKKKETTITYNTVRGNVINEISNYIKDQETINAFEKEIFQISEKEYKKHADFTSPDFLKIYTHHAVFMLQNLDKESYVNSNVMSSTQEISIDPMKLKPTKWKPYEERMTNIANEIMNATEETTDVYQCGKCKQRECIYYISQTRSADEGYTVTIKCKTKGCNNSWREYS
jgi:DNA-directed RNA polymerase subunit M/transcription elongation factor TFIIS